MHITRVPIITFTDMKLSCSANEHHMFCLSLVLFVCLFLKTALFGLKQVLSNVYAIGFLWRRCNFRGKCRARYCDVAKTTCGIRQSNYMPLLLYRIPLIKLLRNYRGKLGDFINDHHVCCMISNIFISK
jgi:hypothetical protein